MNSLGFFISPQGRKGFASHYQYTGGNRMLSAPECDWLIDFGRKVGMQDAAIGNPAETRTDPTYRCAKVALVPGTRETDWLYERLTERIQWANDQDYHFTLAGLLEPLQLLRYDAPTSPDEEAGHYHWHQDFGADYMARRKLSITIQLSDPTEYDGCYLTIMDPGPRELRGVYTERGAGILFPSWAPHCVTPITRGRRYALVAWVHGEPFR